MDELPGEILLDIFSRLPIKSLLRCRCVNKTCFIVTHDPNLPNMHLNRAIQEEPSLVLETSSSLDGFVFQNELYFSENDDRIHLTSMCIPLLEHRIAGSCNGLFCLYHPFHRNPIYVCNPAIGEYIKLPETKTYGFNNFCVSGFGFVPATNTYKVIIIYYVLGVQYMPYQSQVQVYTLGMSNWRILGSAPSLLYGQSSSKAFVNGALHWVSNCGSKLIVSFDIEDEEFKIVPRPEFGVGMNNFHLGVLGGNLSVVDSSFVDRIEIWVMKDYTVMESWTREYVIGQIQKPELIGESLRTLCFGRNGEVLLLHSNVGMFSYDPKTKTFVNHKCLNHWYEVFAHMGSLISLRTIFGLEGTILHN